MARQTHGWADVEEGFLQLLMLSSHGKSNEARFCKIETHQAKVGFCIYPDMSVQDNTVTLIRETIRTNDNASVERGRMIVMVIYRNWRPGMSEKSPKKNDPI
jgi:hypothetical protein